MPLKSEQILHMEKCHEGQVAACEFIYFFHLDSDCDSDF
jgi:hypothetical protein